VPHLRFRLVLVGLVAGLVTVATIGAAQAHGNARATSTGGPVSRRIPRGDIGAGHRVLFYRPTLAKGARINERRIALRLGFRVKVATKDEWSAMTQEDFSEFSTIVFGDPNCKSSADRLDAAIANQATWSAAVDGNVVVGAFDAVWHANHRNRKPGPVRLIANTLRFTGLGAGTGLNVSLSCYYGVADPGTPVDLLAGIGAFTVTGGVNCNRILVPDPDHPLVRRLTAEHLSHWNCSIHAAFDGVPAGFDTVATQRAGIPVLVGRTAS
jgi:hypothetical protein